MMGKRMLQDREEPTWLHLASFATVNGYTPEQYHDLHDDRHDTFHELNPICSFTLGCHGSMLQT